MNEARRKRKKISNKSVRSIKNGQVILEFTFCMIIVLLMLYGVTKVFMWTGRDFAGRIIAHDTKLETAVAQNYPCIATGPHPIFPWIDICLQWDRSVGPAQQVDSYFYSPVKMNAIWQGSP